MKKILMQLLIVMALCSLVACSGAKKDKYLTMTIEGMCEKGAECPPFESISITKSSPDGSYEKYMECNAEHFGADGMSCLSYDSIHEEEKKCNKKGCVRIERSCFDRNILPNEEKCADLHIRIQEMNSDGKVVKLKNEYNQRLVGEKSHCHEDGTCFDEEKIQDIMYDKQGREIVRFMCHNENIGKDGKTCIRYDRITQKVYDEEGREVLLKSCKDEQISSDGKFCTAYDEIEETLYDIDGFERRILRCWKGEIDLNGNCVTYDTIYEFDENGNQFSCYRDKINVAQKSCVSYDEIFERTPSGMRTCYVAEMNPDGKSCAAQSPNSFGIKITMIERITLSEQKI